MRFFPKRSVFESEKNGTLILREFLWWATIYAGGFEQSGPYVIGLWKSAFKKIPHSYSVGSILILGMGLGDNVRIAQKRFPHARITVVEWDKTMIEIALNLHRFIKAPEVIHGDLREILPTLHQTFDIILSDAFYGDQPDVGAESSTVGESLMRMLAPHGLYILNASRTPAAIEYISRYLKLEKIWKFKDNTVGLCMQK